MKSHGTKHEHLNKMSNQLIIFFIWIHEIVIKKENAWENPSQKVDFSIRIFSNMI